MLRRRHKIVMVLVTVAVLQIVALCFMGYSDQSLRELWDHTFESELHGKLEQIADFRHKALIRYREEFPEEDEEERSQQTIILGEYSEDEVFYQVYDPRITFGLLLPHITQQIKQGQDPSIAFFNWADYVDVSGLNVFYRADKRWDCGDFDFRGASAASKKESSPPEQFCINDKNMPVPSEAKNIEQKNLRLIAEGRHRLGFHIFANSGRSSQQMRKVQSKAYLREFMPFPQALVIMVGDQSISVSVHEQELQENNKRRIVGELGQKGEISLAKEVANLAEHMGSAKGVGELKRELSPDQFVENTEGYIAELEKSNLSRSEKSYLESLLYSKSERHPPKYFAEAKLIKREKQYASGGHYDWRFFDGLQSKNKKTLVLHGLISAWLRFTRLHDLTSWLAHGTLLSWSWNGMAFPWDPDSDVQMPISDLHALARRFNQSVIVDFGNDPDKPLHNRYFLDCTSSISHRARGNGLNNIDARFVDMDTGLYIDITGLAASQATPPLRYTERRIGTASQVDANIASRLYNCRNLHFSSFAELSPLTLTSYEGQLAYVPHNYRQTLVNEYSRKSITSVVFKENVFVPNINLWMPKQRVRDFLVSHPSLQPPKVMGHLEISAQTLPTAYDKFSDEDFLDLMFSESGIPAEYMVSRDQTAFRVEEKLRGSIKGMGRVSVDRRDWFSYRVDVEKWAVTEEH